MIINNTTALSFASFFTALPVLLESYFTKYSFCSYFYLYVLADLKPEGESLSATCFLTIDQLQLSILHKLICNYEKNYGHKKKWKGIKL